MNDIQFAKFRNKVLKPRVTRFGKSVIVGSAISAGEGLYNLYKKNMVPTPRTPPRTPKKRRTTNGGGITPKSALFKRVFKKKVGRKRRNTAKYGQKILKQNQGILQHNDLLELDGGAITLGKKMNMPKLLGRYQYLEGKTGVIDSPDGLQLVATLEGLGTRAQFNGTTALVRNGAYEQWECDPFLLNPFVSVQQTSTLYPGPLPAYASQDKIYVKKVYHTLHLYNMETSPCEVNVYYMTPVVDTTTAPGVAWTNALVSEGLTQPLATQGNVIGSNVNTAGRSDVFRYGQDPLKSKTLRKTWKCIKHHKLIFQGGDRQSLNMRINYNRIITKQALTERPSGYYAGMTVWPMIVVRGALVAVVPTTGTPEVINGASTEVNFAPTKIGWVTENTWYFGALPIAKLNTQRTFNPTLVGAESVANQDTAHINVEDDILLDAEL